MKQINKNEMKQNKKKKKTWKKIKTTQHIRTSCFYGLEFILL